MEDLLRRAKQQLLQNLPFVLYCKPYAEDVIGFFQKDNQLHELNDFGESGFVFASFDGNKQFIIPENRAEVITAKFNDRQCSLQWKYSSEVSIQDQNSFQNLVQKAVDEIGRGTFQKVVVSRVEAVTITDFDLLQAFGQLVNLYQGTFAYCFFHPKVGMWMGATPEQLLQLRDNHFETIALAGTQKATGAEVVEWGNKEKEEQRIVTDFLVEKLKPLTEICKSGKPFSIQAGAIWHIKTIVSGQLAKNTTIKNVVDLLHPTPAVCGLPTVAAKEFILENEKYDRKFYTGFLGEWNVTFETAENNSDLFVNLRCMQINELKSGEKGKGTTKIQLYMGCGITKDSIPEKEWEESVNKSSTMKKVFG